MTGPGAQLGAYELLRPLGAGGMAETFVAVRRGPAGFEQRVCLKRILPGCAADPVFVELFLDEARLLARLQNANIVHVYDFGEVEGTYYMALELIDGVDLEGLLSSLRERGERMPESIALYVLSEVLVALDYAHTLEIDGEPQGIVHRDISPSNILLSKHGEVKLTDFGIAKARGRSHRTQTGHTKGKIAYMSPEQMRAEELDGRSDLFALGVVLFELLTGAHPFDANTDFALQVNIMQGKRKPLSELLPSASPKLIKLVDALLAPDRNDRPASASDALALIPPIEAQYTLQRGLEALVKQRIKAKGSAVNTGGLSGPSVPQPSASDAARASSGPAPVRVDPAHSDTALASKPPPGAAAAVAARGTTAGGATKKSSLKPVLWIALAVLVLCAGFVLARSELLPKVAKQEAPVDPLAPPAIPDAPHASGSAQRAEPAHVAPTAPTPTSAVPEVAHEVPAHEGESPSAHEASGHEAHKHHHHAEHHAGASGEALGSAPNTPAPVTNEPPPSAPTPPVTRPNVAPPIDSNAPPVPSLAAPAAPLTPGQDARPTRQPYVTPSGRVVIPAPPL